MVFDDTREDNLKEKLALERKEKAEYAKKVGQLTMQVDWLKKNLKKHLDLTTRVNLVQNLLKTKELPVKTGAALLDINRTSVYYKGTPISQEELDCKLIIDRLHTDNPAWGARQLSAQLKKRGYQVGRRKTRRYMNEMGIDPIYPKMNLSKRMQQAKVCRICCETPLSTIQIRHGQYRHYIHPHQAWIPVSDRYDRLVQPLYRWLGSR